MKYLLITLSTLCLLFACLSYSFYGSKVKAEGDLRVAQASLTALQSSLDKKEQECKIADDLSSKWQKEKDASDKQKDSDIQRIDLIPKKAPAVKAEVESNDEIDIDSALPESIKRVLDETFNRLSK